MGAIPRPIGVTILSILGFISGGITLLIGIAVLVLTGIIEAFLVPLGLGGIATLVGAAIAGVILIAALIVLLLSWGLWTGKNWARLLWIIFSALGILGALGSLATGAYVAGIISLIIDGLIIYYLTRPNVAAYFRHMPMQPTTPPPPK